MSRYLRIGVPSVPSDGAELVSDRLWSLGALGIHEAADAEGTVVLTTAFEPEVDVADVAADVGALAEVSWVEVVVDDESWWDAWRAHADPVWVGGERLVVVPAWLPPPATGPDTLVVTVEPGRTFGSGAHATTRLVLGLMLDRGAAFVGARVLDVGCGSGVLAVVAARLGAHEVVAVDIDPAAVAATEANAAANGVAGIVVAGPVDDPRLAGTFDIVLVNVLPPVLATWVPRLTDLSGHSIAVSGFLAGDEHRACHHFPDRTLVASVTIDGWGAGWLAINRELAKPD